MHLLATYETVKTFLGKLGIQWHGYPGLLNAIAKGAKEEQEWLHRLKAESKEKPAHQKALPCSLALPYGSEPKCCTVHIQTWPWAHSKSQEANEGSLFRLLTVKWMDVFPGLAAPRRLHFLSLSRAPTTGSNLASLIRLNLGLHNGKLTCKQCAWPQNQTLWMRHQRMMYRWWDKPFIFFSCRGDCNADGIKSRVAFSHGCHLWFYARGHIRTPILKCCQLRFITQVTARFPAKKSFQSKTVQLWVFCSCWIFWLRARYNLQSSISPCTEVFSINGSAQQSDWCRLHSCLPACAACGCWDEALPLNEGTPQDPHGTWGSPKPGIWADGGFKQCVCCRLACRALVNTVARVRESFPIF